jgi:hypothetical protein
VATPKRRFPTDEEVDAFIDQSFVGERDMQKAVGVARSDQKVAAALDTEGFLFKVVDQAAKSGFESRRRQPLNGRVTKLGVKLLMAVGWNSEVHVLCGHVKEDRPQWVGCDPPVVVCLACFPNQATKIVSQGFLYEDQCDACGRRAHFQVPVQVNLGPYLVNGHVCSECVDESKRG